MSRPDTTVNGVTAFLGDECEEPPCWCGQHPLASERNHELECRDARQALRRLKPQIPAILEQRRRDRRAPAGEGSRAE